MYDIAQEFVQKYDGDRPRASLTFAVGLMVGDDDAFKAGYSPDNAAIATTEAFELSDDECRALCGQIGANFETVARAYETSRPR